MECLKCWYITKLQTCCCTCFVIFMCSIGLVWGTFMIVFSVTYEMAIGWKYTAFISGLLSFLSSIVVLVSSLYTMSKENNCCCQKYSMEGNSGDLSELENQEDSTKKRIWNIFRKKSDNYSLVELNLNLTPSSIQTNSENDGPTTSEQSFLPIHQMNDIMEGVQLQTFGHQLSNIRQDRANNRVSVAEHSALEQRASREFASDRFDIFENSRIGVEISDTINQPSQQENMISNTFNFLEQSEENLETPNETIVGRMISTNSDTESHIYEDINSSYEEENEGSDYEYIEFPTLPNRPPPKLANTEIIAREQIPSFTNERAIDIRRRDDSDEKKPFT